jgi:hypothetical protein
VCLQTSAWDTVACQYHTSCQVAWVRVTQSAYQMWSGFNRTCAADVAATELVSLSMTRFLVHQNCCRALTEMKWESAHCRCCYCNLLHAFASFVSRTAEPFALPKQYDTVCMYISCCH